jgi:hypothetical protein
MKELIIRRIQVFTGSHGSEREHLVVIKYVLSRFRTLYGVFAKAENKMKRRKESFASLAQL